MSIAIRQKWSTVMEPYWLSTLNPPPFNGVNSNGGTFCLKGALTKLRYWNWPSFFSNAQCCISTFTGFFTLEANDTAYTALISCEPQGNLNFPPTKALTATSQVSVAETVSSAKCILSPHWLQLRDWVWLPWIKWTTSPATWTSSRQSSKEDHFKLAVLY